MSPWSPTRATLPAPARATTTVGITRANSELTTAKRVRASSARIASAPSPASSEGRLIRPGWVSTLTALANGDCPFAGAPVRSEIWPHTMLTEIPVRKPIITEYETNRVYRPRRTTPAATRAAPARSTSRAMAPGRWAGATPCRAEPAASAAADVVVMTMSRVCELSPPAIGPAKPAYSPCTGLTPARTAAAIPSGTLLIARGSPATRSARRCARSGPIVRSQRPVAARDGRTGFRTCRPPAAPGGQVRGRPARNALDDPVLAAVPGSPAPGGGGLPAAAYCSAVAETAGQDVLRAGSPLRTPRAAAVAGILFSVLLILALVLLKISVPLIPRFPACGSPTRGAGRRWRSR